MPEIKPDWIGKATDQIRVPAEGFTRIYANNFTLSLSNWDMSLTFGEIVGEQDGKPIIEEKVKVTMSMPHAKAIHHLLGLHLAGYEKMAGEIKILSPTPSTEDDKLAEEIIPIDAPRN